MGKVVLYVAQSMDGYLADKDGGVGWLEAFNAGGEDFGYKAFLETIGTLIMGSTTYEQVLGWGWSYDTMPAYIITRRALTQKPNDAVQFYGGDLGSLVRDIKAKSDKDIWLVGGGKLVTSFLQARLIDAIQLAVMPLMLGEGLPLFPPGFPRQDWTLTHHQAYPQGVIMLTYQRTPDENAN